MRARYPGPASVLAGFTFLLSVCVLLPIVFFRVVAVAVTGGAAGPVI